MIRLQELREEFRVAEHLSEGNSIKGTAVWWSHVQGRRDEELIRHLLQDGANRLVDRHQVALFTDGDAWASPKKVDSELRETIVVASLKLNGRQVVES